MLELIISIMTVTALQELHDPSSFSALAHVPHRTNGPLPLLLYLHGAGESGTDVRGIISEGATGTPPVELEHGRALPVLAKHFVVVAPVTDHGWEASEVTRFLDYLLSGKTALPALDPSRCYITGHSMGGGGALVAAASLPHRFAAAVPVAPAGTARPSDLAGVPLWIFHGRNDIIVPSHISERLVARLRTGGASEGQVKLTLYDDAPAPSGWPGYQGHGSPIPAYATPELWRWLLEQRLPAAIPVEAQTTPVTGAPG
jgi:predicted peptidase